MKFRKKPIVVDALQFDGTIESAYKVKDFVGTNARTGLINGNPWVNITTMEGVLTVSPCDWVIKGIKGEFYPCKPDIFSATYEKEEL